MKNLMKPLFAVGLAFAAAPMIATPASAQVVKGIGVVNIPAAVANSSAYQTAEQQRRTTYKAQIDQAQARRTQIAQQLDPLVKQYQAALQSGSANQQSLQQQAAQITRIQQQGQQELDAMLEPILLSTAYTNEQIEAKLNGAVQAAAQRKNITIIFNAAEGAVVYADKAYNITKDVIDELNRQLPAVQIVPPEGWQPAAVRARQAAAQGAAGGTPQPAGTAPQGR